MLRRYPLHVCPGHWCAGSIEIDARLRPVRENQPRNPSRRSSPGRSRRPGVTDRLEYTREGKRYRFAPNPRTVSGVPPAAAEPSPSAAPRPRVPFPREAGRKTSSTPRRKLKAVYRDRNLLAPRRATGGARSRSPPTAARKTRIKYGTASWVYGEELAQTDRDVVVAGRHARSPTTASTRSRCPTTSCSSTRRKLQSDARHRGVSEGRRAESDRRPVRLRRRHEEVDAGRRPRRQAVRQHRRRPLRLSRRVVAGRHASCSSTAPTAGRTSWSSRPPTRRPGKCRVVVREEWPTGWVENKPRHAVPEGRPALHLGIAAQRLEQLLPLRSERQADRAAHDAHDVRGRQRCVKIDEAAGVLFYTARDGDNSLKLQLHRVGLDGKGDRRLTDPAFHHTIGGCIAGARSRRRAAGGRRRRAASRRTTGISSTSTRRTTRRRPRALVDAASGKVVAELAKSDVDEVRRSSA